MIRRLRNLFIFLFISISHCAYSQDEIFHEIVFEKKLMETENWAFGGEANFKNLYSENGWRRWGVSLNGVRKLKPFMLTGGLNGYYTFNNENTNFFEFRPWAALQLNIPIVAKISFRQRLKLEWRLFYTEDDESTRENYRRVRYQISFDIPIPIEGESTWKIRPFFEWFYIREPATFERFSNERDFGVMVVKNLTHEHELTIGYRIEEFYKLTTKLKNGHTLIIEYSL